MFTIYYNRNHFSRKFLGPRIISGYNVVMKIRSHKFKKDLFLTESIKSRLEAKGVKEEEVLEDFEKFSKARRRC